MTSQTGKAIIPIQILPNILRSKGHQAIRFGPLIKYNMRNIFLEKSETSPRPFFKKLKFGISLDKQSQVSYSLFLLYVQV